MARLRVAELQYNVKANTSDFSKGMQRAERELKKAQRAVREIGESITKIFAPATAAVIGLAIAGQRLGNTLEDVAEELGITTTALQALRNVTSQNGETNERLTKTLRNLSDRTAQAAAGNESMRKHFAALNLDVEQFIKLPLERQLEAVAFAQDRATNKAQAHSAVMGILGTFSGPKMMRTLRDLSSRGYPEVQRAAEEAGMVMSTETIAKMAEIGQKVSDVITQLRIFGAEVAVYLIKPLEELDKKLGVTKKIGELTNWFKSLHEETKEAIGTIALLTATIGPLIIGLSLLIGSAVTLVGLVAKMKFAFVAGWAAIKAGGVVLAAVLKPITAIVLGITAAIAATLAFTNALDGVGKSLIGERLTVQLKIFSIKFLQTATDWGLEMLRQIALLPRYIAAFIGTAVAYVNWQFENGLMDTIAEAGKEVLNTIGNAFARVGNAFFDLIKGLFSVFVNSVKADLNWLIAQANKVLGTSFEELPTDENLTIQKAIADAFKPITDALFSASKQTGDTFDLRKEFSDRLGDTSTGVPAMLADLQDRAAAGMDVLIDTQERRLKRLDASTNSAADSTNKLGAAADKAANALTESAEYSEDAKALAQRTLDEIAAGRLSTTKDTRLEAEAILRGEAISGESERFRKFGIGSRPERQEMEPFGIRRPLNALSSDFSGKIRQESSVQASAASIDAARGRTDQTREDVAALEEISSKLDILAEGWRKAFEPAGA